MCYVLPEHLVVIHIFILNVEDFKPQPHWIIMHPPPQVVPSRQLFIWNKPYGSFSVHFHLSCVGFFCQTARWMGHETSALSLLPPELLKNGSGCWIQKHFSHLTEKHAYLLHFIPPIHFIEKSLLKNPQWPFLIAFDKYLSTVFQSSRKPSNTIPAFTMRSSIEDTKGVFVCVCLPPAALTLSAYFLGKKLASLRTQGRKYK